MKKYFNVQFEFDHQKLETIVKNKAKEGKGYCCFVDLNSLTNSFKYEKFRIILNNSLSNSCDGSYIAMLASSIHKAPLKEYIAPDFFEEFIYHKNKHLLIGNTEEVFKKIIKKVAKRNTHADNLNYLYVPFLTVDQFDYIEISKAINKLSPDYMWISLGAPKQEFFMSKLLPHISRGVMLGVGASTNYFSGEIKDIPKWAKKLKIIWLYRLCTEPKKQAKRIWNALFILPMLILNEKRMLKNK
jgi:N-acetylglucosaminyldiphosphoundecaprenol N-acetyl-beta-D-mannosaminyltransferase